VRACANSSRCRIGTKQPRSTQAALRERIEFETTALRVEAKSQLGYEKSPGTLLHRLHVVRKQHGIKEPTPETVSDFASLLRQPARKSRAKHRKLSLQRRVAKADIGIVYNNKNITPSPVP
jgi:hypothetical protein